MLSNNQPGITALSALSRMAQTFRRAQHLIRNFFNRRVTTPMELNSTELPDDQTHLLLDFTQNHFELSESIEKKKLDSQERNEKAFALFSTGNPEHKEKFDAFLAQAAFDYKVLKESFDLSSRLLKCETDKHATFYEELDRSANQLNQIMESYDRKWSGKARETTSHQHTIFKTDLKEHNGPPYEKVTSETLHTVTIDSSAYP